MNQNDFDVIVVGGGPAGCTVASYLARDGYRVVLFERDQHPRHRIGESLLPSMMPILEDFGLIDECHRRGFTRKSGATFTWGKDDQPWHLKWHENPFLPYSYAFHVERSSFDEMLLLHAKSVGVDVREQTKVTGPLYASTDKSRVNGVTWETADGQKGEVRARYVVDASGSASVIGKNMSERRYDDRMKQVAFYSYFDNVAGPAEQEKEGIQEHIVITTCKYGWFWWIPINSPKFGQVSCGLVSGQEFQDEFRAEGGGGPEKFFFKALETCPRVKEMLGPDYKQVQKFRAVMDWSYACDKMAGEGYFLCGDAACFLDPLISTGVSLAMISAFSASVCINSILKDPSREREIINFYQRNYRQMYDVTRDFLHYFYAGATSAYTDELFWKGRKNLRLGENVGAKQAFTYFTAIIPGNPHPAVNKQISLFKNMMTHVEFPEEKIAAELKEQLSNSKVREVAHHEVADDTRLVVNGQFERSFQIDSNKRTLTETWGISYDKERPVLSNTASWLMGQNFYGVNDAEALVLKCLQSEKSWAQVRDEVRRANQAVDLDAVLKKLCEQRLVLKAV